MKEFLTKREMASLLRISIHTLNLWVCRKKIPYLKLGDSRNSAVRFDPEETQQWLENMRGKLRGNED